MRLLLGCLIAAGCGRLGFDASDAASDASSVIVDTVELTPPSFSTSSVDFVDIPGATATIAPSPGAMWLILTSATLASTNIAAQCVEARYLVDATERGMGGTQGTGAGPWQHFYLLPGSDAPQTLTYQLRDASAGTATIDQLHVIIVKLPDGAEPHYASADPIREVTSMEASPATEVLSLGAMAGDYVVLTLANSSDAPGESDMYVKWLGPGGEILQAVSQNPREPWQSQLMVRVLSVSSPDALFTLQSYTDEGGGIDVGSQRYVRVLALRTTGFASLDQTWTTTPITTTSPNVSIGPQLAPAGSAARYLYMASSWSDEDCTETTASLRRLHFIVDGVDRMTEHATDNCAFQLTYGVFGLLSTRPDTMANGVSSANGFPTVMGESQIVLVGLP